MKKIKIVSLIVAVVMLVSLLTGCVCANLSITVNKDGSSAIAIYSGFTKEGVAIISGVDVTEITDDVLSDFQQYEYNNKTYYGETQDVTFANIDELNGYFKAQGAEQNINVFSFEKTDGGYIMNIDLTGNQSLEDTVASEMGSEATDELTDAEVKEILKEMVVIIEINYPEGKVSRLDRRGNVPGLTQVTDSCYRIDLIEFSLAETEIDFLKFALTDGEAEVPAVKFDDVPESEWYYTAISEIAASGVVKGVGDNKFNPEGTLTYAEFCQMVYNTTGINPLVEHGYWAYVAIENALNNGFIKSLGDITEENYDVPINREEAIAALYRVINSERNFGKPVAEYKTVESYNIPDIAEISSQYAEEIKAAYQLGLTKGSDDLGTFYPKNSLTRAEMCQLFYNIMNK